MRWRPGLPSGVGVAVRWDLFCKVVDNFGDIGVCWRLARQLVAEHQIAVTLWVDDLASLAKLCPGVRTDAHWQQVHGVRVGAWAEPLSRFEPGDAVIEAFGCGLPETVLAAMAAAPRTAVWINLEHLSAERWVLGCHGLPSPHPKVPIRSWFYYPGFEAGTGGLIREDRLLERRDDFLAAPDSRRRMLSALGIAAVPEDALVVSLFCYPYNAVAALLEALSGGSRRVLCLVPEGVAPGPVRAALGAEPAAGAGIDRGNLALRVIAFLEQDAYDNLLWTCDWNFVRGEDSFVRAQWAGRPFVWSIYAQSDRAHVAKLETFLDTYLARSNPSAAATALSEFWRLWNAGGRDAAALARAWEDMLAQRDALRLHARDWAYRQGTRRDLAAELVSFYLSRV